MRRAGGAGCCGPSSATSSVCFCACLAFLRAAISASVGFPPAPGLPPFCFFSFSSAMTHSQTLVVLRTTANWLFLAGATQIRAALDRDAMLGAVLFLEPHACAFSRCRVQRHHVADVDRRVLLNATALRIPLIGTHVLPHAIDTFDDNAIAIGNQPQNAADFATVGARYDHHLLAGFNVPGHHTTSLARETIFMKFLSRSSRATAPKIRVPLGLFSSSITTAAFLSKRT